MKTWIPVLLLMCSFWAQAETNLKPFTKQIFVLGVGQVKLHFFTTFDPVSRPRTLQIFKKCAGSKTWDPVGEYKMCDLHHYEYDAKEKKLILKYTDGRVTQSTGESFCDVPGDAALPLADVCKAESAPPPPDEIPASK